MKAPRLLLPNLYAFSPNRETLGGTAYFIVKKTGNILIDSPPWTDEIQQFLTEQGGVAWFCFTHRGAISKQVTKIHQTFSCPLVIQEQEAYLLPNLPVHAFGDYDTFSEDWEALWTPGFSPGSACFYTSVQGGILFSGRHLLPDQTGQMQLLRFSKTFHWQRQLNSLDRLCDHFTPQTLTYLCPAANTGFLRGKGFVSNGYQQLITAQSFVKQQTSPAFLL